MAQAAQTTGRELLLAASLLARPEFTTVLFPRGDTSVITNALAREVIAVLATQGPAYATPGAMEAALVDRGAIDEDSTDEFAELVRARPLKDDVSLESLVAIKHEVEAEASARRFAVELKKIASLISLKPHEVEVQMTALRKAMQEHQARRVGVDATAAGILSRLGTTDKNVRWRLGAPMFDELVEGIGPDGDYGYGMIGQGEVSVILAGYGTGKTRWLLNIVAGLLDQGASCSVVAAEDTDAAYLSKLMGVRFGLRMALIARYARGAEMFARTYGSEMAQRVEEAYSWAADVKDRLRIYDESGRVRLTHFGSLVSLLEEDVALHGTHFTAIDYGQAVIKSTEIAEVEGRVQELSSTLSLHLSGR